MRFKCIPLLAAALALAAGTAQAARLQLLESMTHGSHLIRVDTGIGEVLAQTGQADDLSGRGTVLAHGAGAVDRVLDGSLLRVQGDWSRRVALDATGAITTFQAAGSSAWRFGGHADLSALESADIGLEASLLVAPDHEAQGTPVVVQLQLTAGSLFSASFVHPEDTPTFHLQVLDADFRLLAGYRGVALRGADTLDLRFDSAVGETLSFSLGYANGLAIVGASISGTNTVDASALLDGSMSVTAVPEPQGTALMLAGMACLGMLHLRSRRQGSQR